MKDFTTFINEAKSLDIQDNTINHIGSEDLKKYVKITDKFISDEAKYICQWLINNNSSYVRKLGSGSGNALASFYAKGKPKDENLQELYKCLGVLNKKNRLLEVPVFLNDEQFEGIINKTMSPDEILLDLTTEAGKNAVVKKYYPLVMKIVNSFKGKSINDFEELKSAGLHGLAYAIESYGKKQRKKPTDADVDTQKEAEAIKSTTFLQYASFAIRNHILWSISESHLVRIPLSAQKKERDEKGHNTRNNSVSGEQSIGHDKDGGEGRTIFDLLGVDSVDAESALNRQDLAKVDAQMNKLVKQKFGEMTYDIFASFFGIWGHKKMKNKELATKYNCGVSRISYYIKKPLDAMKGGDKELHSLACQFNELMAESVRLKDIADEDPYTHDTSIQEKNNED